MDTRKQNKPETWDDGVYGTGKTQPPKSDGWIITLLLVIVIFLTGITSGLGILNIKLFRQLNAQSEFNSVPMSFSDGTGHDGPMTQNFLSIGETMPQEHVQIQLNRAPESYENIPQEGGLSWQAIYEKNIPSFVSITCRSWGISDSGAGVVLTRNGYLVTNCHLVEDAEEITATLTDGRSYTALLIGTDRASDLAVLYIPAENLTPAEFGDSGALRTGDAVAAIGDPLGQSLRGTMHDGIVSAINRNVSVAGRGMTLIQTSATGDAGFSGGPLINCYGQVVGINTRKVSNFADGGDSNVEFCLTVPSTTVKDVVDQLIRYGYVAGRPTLGLESEEISAFYQNYYRLPAGMFVTEVEDNSQAQEAGIQPGDILLQVGDTPVTDEDILDQVLYAHKIGDTVTVVIWREGTEQALALILEEEH